MLVHLEEGVGQAGPRGRRRGVVGPHGDRWGGLVYEENLNLNLNLSLDSSKIWNKFKEI
jgi:hypothetical protein